MAALLSCGYVNEVDSILVASFSASISHDIKFQPVRSIDVSHCGGWLDGFGWWGFPYPHQHLRAEASERVLFAWTRRW